MKRFLLVLILLITLTDYAIAETLFRPFLVTEFDTSKQLVPITYGGGLSINFYPTFESIAGFSLEGNTQIGISDKTENNISGYFNANAALNLRFPVENLDFHFSYLSIGSTVTISSDSKNIGIFIGIGHDYGLGHISLGCTCDFITLDTCSLKSDNFRFKISCKFSWTPLLNLREIHNKDKEIVRQWQKNEDVFSDKYRLYKETDKTVSSIFPEEEMLEFWDDSDFQLTADFYNTPVISKYYCRTTSSFTNSWIGDPFVRNIRFKGYDLEKIESIPLYQEYLYEKWIELPFYTDDDKQRAFETLIKQYKFKIEKERKEKAPFEIEYNVAKSSNDINALITYIKNNYNSKYFNKEVYTEIAKLISKNDNVVLESLSAYTHPHDSEEKYLYYDEHINVTLRINDGSFLAKSSFGDLIFIRNVYWLARNANHIANVYLKRIGDYEYSTSDGTESIPQFDLIYSFEMPWNYYW